MSDAKQEKSRISRPLSLKLSAFIIAMCLLISGLILVFSYQIYEDYSEEQFANRGEQVASVASRYVDWDKIEEYYDTGVMDEDYDETVENFRQFAYAEGAKYIYVIMPQKDGFVYIFDSDEDEETHLDLGTFSSYAEFFGEIDQNPIVGEPIDPFIVEEDGAPLLSVYFPNNSSDGRFAGYLGVDYDATDLEQQKSDFLSEMILIMLAITVVVTVVFNIVLRTMVVQPIRKMERAASGFGVEGEEDTDYNSIATLDIKTNDELNSLSESLKTMDHTIKDYVTDLEVANRRAAADSMTGLLNREAFKREVSLLLADVDKDESHAFFMVDLDDFKTVNDTKGHVVGDDVILETASIMRSKFRATDLVARVGGDEFAAYYRHVDSYEEVERRAQELCEAARKNMVDEDTVVTFSVGVAYFTGMADCTYQDLYIAADAALYDAKLAGRNGYVIRCNRT